MDTSRSGNTFFNLFLNLSEIFFEKYKIQPVVASTIQPKKFYDYEIEMVIKEKNLQEIIFEIICPQNITSGNSIKINYKNDNYYVKVPNRVRSGNKFLIKIPILFIPVGFVNDSISNTTVVNEMYKNSVT
jgi:hypothetical protein